MSRLCIILLSLLMIFSVALGQTGGPGVSRVNPSIDYFGPQFTVSGGTGTCATTSTLVGGSTTGRFTCTGTAGAATIVINLPLVVNGWVCEGNDLTTTTDSIHQTASSTTSCTMSAAALVASDVINFMAKGY